MNFTPRNIFDWRDRQYAATKGYLTFRLYETGWLVRFTPLDGKPDSIDGVDVWTACRFANDCIQEAACSKSLA